MSRKIELAERALAPGAKLAPLCREFGISRPTGHKWRQRYLAQGVDGLEEQSRRPKSSPLSLAEDVVAAVVETRDAHPTWGPKKIHVLFGSTLHLGNIAGVHRGPAFSQGAHVFVTTSR